MADSTAKIDTIGLKTPITRADLEGIEVGTVVYLDVLVMTAREGVYQRIVGDGMAPPDDLSRIANVNFHYSPAASVNDDGSFNVGAFAATASFRFAKWLPRWFEAGACRVIIGKSGMRQARCRDIFVPAGAVYLTTVGYGTGALLGRGIVAVEAAHWLDELAIAQAIRVLKVENFGPLPAESDLEGNSLFERNNRGPSMPKSKRLMKDRSRRRRVAMARPTTRPGSSL